MQLAEHLYHWNLESYHRLLELGILTSTDRVELLEGSIIQMSPKGIAHVITLQWVAEQLRALLPSVTLRIQDPISLPLLDSEPEPDIVIAKGSILSYRSHHPYPEDILLLIEVADSSLSIDRDVKAGIYAKTGIVEYWIVDVNQQEILMFRQPSCEGYGYSRVLHREDTLTFHSFPGLRMSVADCLPPPNRE